MIKKVIVLGGGSAGFLAALALARRIPGLEVVVIRSKEIGVIGVGEGSTADLTGFLHDYIRVNDKKFHEIARPTWKLGLKFLWGPRSHFFYAFGPGLESREPGLVKTNAYYCDDELAYADLQSSLMELDRAFERGAGGAPVMHRMVAYHFENERFVDFLEQAATGLGVTILDDTVLEVRQDDAGIAGLRLASSQEVSGDLYVDCSGFGSLLLGKTLKEPYVSFKTSLFCDRAVVGGWDRTEEPIKPYTLCETMDAGWSWQIEHEGRINRGYVYSSDFVSDADAEEEFRRRNPKVGPTRVVKFSSGHYARAWVKNVVAIGNAYGFVEPLEATALGAIAAASTNLADSLLDADLRILPTQVAHYNAQRAGKWDSIRQFLAVHYKFNTRLDTPFWQACRAKTDLVEAEPIVEYFRENGPSRFWEKRLLGINDQFGMAGYFAMLVGQKVPYDRRHEPTQGEWSLWNAHRQKNKDRAMKAMTVKAVLEVTRSSKWKWATAPVR